MMMNSDSDSDEDEDESAPCCVVLCSVLLCYAVSCITFLVAAVAVVGNNGAGGG